MFDQHDHLSAMIQRGREAQRKVARWDQKQIDQLVAAAGLQMWDVNLAQDLSEKALAETSLGRGDHMFERHRLRVWGILSDLHGQPSCGVVERDEARGIVKFAQPVGMICVMIPETAPAAAVACNALNVLKTRNAALFCPNPRAKRVVAETVAILRDTISKLGAPTDLLQVLEDPNREAADAASAMSDLVIATGGQGVTDRARKGSTPAWIAGVGNAAVLIDDTADVRHASEAIVRGKSFDNATSCSAENTVLVDRSVSQQFRDAMRDFGAHIVSYRMPRPKGWIPFYTPTQKTLPNAAQGNLRNKSQL